MSATRLRLLARIGAWACVVVGVGLALTTVVTIWTTPASAVFGRLGLSTLDHAAAWQLHLGRVLACLPTTIGALAVLALAGSFRSIARGELFAAGTVGGLTRFAGLTLGALVVSIAVPPLTSVAVSHGAAAGEGRLVFVLGSQQVFILLAAGTLWLLSHLLREASRLERENAEFV